MNEYCNSICLLKPACHAAKQIIFLEKSVGVKFIRMALVLVLCSIITAGCQFEQNSAGYGVFIGLDSDNIEILYGYETVVIDAAYYSESEIGILHQKGVKIYSYLNIGTVETFRESYADYQHCTLSAYEDWPGEYWMDVSRPEWQEHIAEEANALAKKGVDGFFLDNLDVYYEYPKPEIFEGLVAIIGELEKLQKDIVINGGDVFVTKAILEKEDPLIKISGVNQECVFTNIDFEEDTLVAQDAVTSQYYRNYLEECSKANLVVYITEYMDDDNEPLRKAIEQYCGEHHFAYFISSSKLLVG